MMIEGNPAWGLCQTATETTAQTECVLILGGQQGTADQCAFQPAAEAVAKNGRRLSPLPLGPSPTGLVSAPSSRGEGAAFYNLRWPVLTESNWSLIIGRNAFILPMRWQIPAVAPLAQLRGLRGRGTAAPQATFEVEGLREGRQLHRSRTPLFHDAPPPPGGAHPKEAPVHGCAQCNGP